MQHPTFSATLADQHRDQLRGQADQIRLSRTGRTSRRPRRLSTAHWWRPTARPAQT
jgi:hypothetical protein